MLSSSGFNPKRPISKTPNVQTPNVHQTEPRTSKPRTSKPRTPNVQTPNVYNPECPSGVFFGLSGCKRWLLGAVTLPLDLDSLEPLKLG